MIVDVKITGLQDVLNRIKGWIRNVDRGAVLDQVSRVLEQSIIANYNEEGRPSWPQRKYSYPWPILRKTGAKRATELNSTHRSWRKTQTGHEQDISSTDYGVFHQFGRGQEVRKAVKLTEQEIEEIKKVLLEGYFN